MEAQLRGKALISQVVMCSGRERGPGSQLEAARVLAYLHRLHAIQETDGVVLFRVLVKPSALPASKSFVRF